MTNREAAKALQSHIGKNEPVRRAKLLDALRAAIAALKDPMLQRKKSGAMGGTAQKKKYGKKQMSTWGKLGGRPAKKKAA